MLDISIEEYIRKVAFLEKFLGIKTQYQILDPFPLYPKDIIGIQNVGKIIANFIGLSDYAFVISINKLEKNTGGRIGLEYDKYTCFPNDETSLNIYHFCLVTNSSCCYLFTRDGTMASKACIGGTFLENG